jgi:hypothetical protein
MTRRFDVGRAPDIRPRLDGRALDGVPVQFYQRKILGVDVCGLWVGGQPVYDVTVYDVAGRPLGKIESEGPRAQQVYDELRRVLVAEEIHA